MYTKYGDESVSSAQTRQENVNSTSQSKLALSHSYYAIAISSLVLTRKNEESSNNYPFSLMSQCTLAFHIVRDARVSVGIIVIVIMVFWPTPLSRQQTHPSPSRVWSVGHLPTCYSPFIRRERGARAHP